MDKYNIVLLNRDSIDDYPFTGYKAVLKHKNKILAAMDLIYYNHDFHKASYYDIKLNMDIISIGHSEWYEGLLGAVSRDFFYIEDIRSFVKGKGYGSLLLREFTKISMEKFINIGGSLPDSNKTGKYSDIPDLISFYEFEGFSFQGHYFYKKPRINVFL
jgi:hypothetical protein